jgi:LemA protein
MQSIFNFITAIFWLTLVLAVALAVLAGWGYNELRKKSEDVKAAWSNIAVVTRKKIALINQLIDVVRGYQESEKLVMLKVSEDQSASTFQQTYQQSGTVVAQINALAQRFPDLKASAQYNRLIDSIQGSETDVQNARTRYNGTVNEYNVRRSSIPHVFYSQMLGFQKADYLSLEAEESTDAGIQKPMISDDGERLNDLFVSARMKTVATAKEIFREGKLMAERGAVRLQQMEQVEEYHYLDAQKAPAGPASHLELKVLFESGAITETTPILKAGSKNWLKYQDLDKQPVG